MRIILFITVTVFILILFYNYIIKPVDLNIILLDNKSEGIVLIDVNPVNELGFRVPIFLFKVQGQIIEGYSIVELKNRNKNSFLLIKKEPDSSGKVVLKFELDDGVIQKFFELYLITQKV